MYMFNGYMWNLYNVVKTIINHPQNNYFFMGGINHQKWDDLFIVVATLFLIPDNGIYNCQLLGLQII